MRRSWKSSDPRAVGVKCAEKANDIEKADREDSEANMFCIDSESHGERVVMWEETRLSKYPGTIAKRRVNASRKRGYCLSIRRARVERAVHECASQVYMHVCTDITIHAHAIDHRTVHSV